ncbi:HMG box domain-containing protein [Mycena kentingensis (nom. inval.)]|nr:HMG box domain-containing protein [Mycena kentingensis (nom. inval.)]
MPAVRLSSRRGSTFGRRRSSIATTLAKPGNYGYTSSPPATTITFAPNVTPTTFTAPSRSPSPFSPTLMNDMPLPIFPPSETPAPPPTRKRAPPGKRRSQGYIPRPPNAFMLFRADFVRQKHVPGTIETNHGSLSKIIGNCWRSLPLPEKHIWEVKAKHAKAEHKLKYPDYKFRPVHNKQRGTAAPSPAPCRPSVQPASARSGNTTIKGQLSPEEDERRCEEVAALLLQGKKGQELASAVKDLDERRHPNLYHSEPMLVSTDDVDYGDKYPHPLNLDPLYYSHLSQQQPQSPPSSALASTASGTASPYSLPTPLDQAQAQQQQLEYDQWRLRHRRSSSVPLPNDYRELVLPPPNGYTPEFGSYPIPPPPPTSAEDSLAGAAMGIAGSRMSFGFGSSNNFSYPRPSFSFGFGGRESFSYGGAFGAGGAWAPNHPHLQTGNGVDPLGGRRASSAQAFFSPTTIREFQQQQQQQQGEEELPDADTSLFNSSFLNSFGAAPASAGNGGGAESVSPLEGPGPHILHAPQPIHPVSVMSHSPLASDFAPGELEIAHAYDQQPPVFEHAPYPVPTETQDYSSFELDRLEYKSRLPSISMDMPNANANFEEVGYASEFV